jgi:hypothetical protein
VTGEWLPPKAPGADEPLPGPPPERPPQQPPSNSDAVAGFTCGIIGLSLLFFTGGLSTIVSLTLGIVAIVLSRKGKQNVEEGRTPKQKSLAGAGLVIGIVTIVLSVIATIGWVLVLTLA